MDTRFRSKYSNLSVLLRSAKRDIVQLSNGEKKVQRTPSVRCEFENGVYDAEDDSIPFSTEKTIKMLKDADGYGQDFWHVEEPVTAQKLVNKSIRELNNDGELEEVEEAQIIVKAIKLEKDGDNRKTALNKFKKKLEEFGFTYDLEDKEKDEEKEDE